jgi:hypothetical protein
LDSTTRKKNEKGETIITIQGHVFPNDEPSRFVYAPVKTISIENNQCVLRTGLSLRLMKGAK